MFCVERWRAQPRSGLPWTWRKHRRRPSLTFFADLPRPHGDKAGHRASGWFTPRPRFLCLKKPELFTFSVDWLVLADNKSFPSTTSSNSRRIFFDAGGSRFVDALNFFVTKYEERDIEMDQIYVWEMEKKNASQYWAGTPEDVRAKWEPRLTWYNGIPVSINEGDMHNPVHRIRELCRMGDFCAFKLDIDTPKVEGALVQQLLEDHGHLTEFFFEHHVQSHLMHLYWLRDINFDQNFEHSYDLFSALREKGLRAHSWI